jgi:hypothetical protein
MGSIAISISIITALNRELERRLKLQNPNLKGEERKVLFFGMWRRVVL